MNRIKVNSEYPVDLSKLDPDDVFFQTIYFSIDETHAIATNGLDVDLVKVVPDEQDPGAYRVAEHSAHLTIAVDDQRTVAGLIQIVQRLRQMSAYQLLTENFSVDPVTQEYLFIINRAAPFRFTTELGEDAEPVNEQNPKHGQDY